MSSAATLPNPPLVHSAAESRPWLLPAHIGAVSLVQGTSMAVQALLPVIAKKELGANVWQVAIITAATTALFCLSIFWNDVFSRMRVGRYMLIYWTICCMPLGLFGVLKMAGVTLSVWHLMGLHLFACLGLAGYHPAAGELLRAFYPPHSRGRVYAIIWGVSLTFSAVCGFAIGKALERNPQAYEWLFPTAALAQLAGVLSIITLAKVTGADASRTLAKDSRRFYSRVLEPVTHMREVLRSDSTFFRYEAAYMTYGIGWMIVYVLMPNFGPDKLHTTYEQYAQSTHVAYLVAVIAMIYPAGLMLDKLGPMRSTGLSFLMLTLYPLGLIFTNTVSMLTIMSVIYGLAHAGASIGWMMGPVSLAPSPDKVPQYVAIHATLVGVRGMLFQFLGVAVFWIASELLHLSAAWAFGIPFAIGAAGYLWSGVQMMQLSKKTPAAT